MPGYAFLNKKEFHPGTFKNIERVWQAERAAEENLRLISERNKRLEEERYEAKMLRHQVDSGQLPESELLKMDWMYNQGQENAAGLEEFLTGKAASFAPKARLAEAPAGGACRFDEFRKRIEDPLILIKKAEKSGAKKPNRVIDNAMARIAGTAEISAVLSARHRISKMRAAKP